MVTKRTDFAILLSFAIGFGLLAYGIVGLFDPAAAIRLALAFGALPLVPLGWAHFKLRFRAEEADIDSTRADTASREAETFARELANWYAANPEAERKTETAASHVLVAGGMLDEWERHHLDGLMLTLKHAKAADSLTSPALVGPAFTDAAHWQYWTDVLAESRLVEKQNGVATRVAGGQPYVWAMRQVMAGLFESPVQYKGAPLPRPPHPFRADYYDKVKPPKAAKAG